MRIKAVIMDFGNTLVDYPLMDWDSQITFTKDFFAGYIGRGRLKWQGSPRELAVRLNTENKDGSVWRFGERVRSTSFFGKSLSPGAARALELDICQAVFERAVRFQDSLEFVSMLRVLGYLTGIVSNLPWGTSSVIWNQEFVRHGFTSNLIDRAVCCVDVGFRKPHPAALRECISRLKCDPHEVLFVGDGVSDTQASLAAGCVPVLLDRRNANPSYRGIRVITLFDIIDLLPDLAELSSLRTVPSTVEKKKHIPQSNSRQHSIRRI